MEKGNPTDFVTKLIPKLLGEENFDNKPVKIDCVHRIRGRAAAADAPPRQIIARIHHDPVQEHILRLSSQKFLSVKNVTSTGINCEELTPVKTEEFTSEHTSVSLFYKYHTTIAVGDYVFWYRQHPGKPPEFLIYISGSNFTKPADSLKKKRFFTQLSEDKHGVKLQINSAAVTDSAVYYCAVKPTVTGNTTTLYKNTTSTRGSINCEELTPVKTEEFTSEHTSVSLSYKYHKSAAAGDYFLWYRQHPGKPPEFLMSHSGTGETFSALVSGLSVTEVIEPVKHAEWAAPVVPVLKPDDTVRLCGDYKLTVNQISKLEQYPIPRIEDLFATLSGGQKFTRIRGRAAAADAPPRQIIARIHHDPVQEHILRLSSQKFLSVKNVTSTGINCEELTPVKTEEFTSEHTSVSLSYKYHTTIAVGDDFFWYRQHPGKPPEFLIYISGSNFTKPADSLKKKRFFTQLSEDKHGVKLQINSAAVTDSAVYYCAVRPTVTGNTTNLYKNTTSTRGSHILLHLSGFL
ncbi:T-cell receptor alpha [Solea senegalensis]|nr:T-cell receptor alpha [Solea senegalensis]